MADDCLTGCCYWEWNWNIVILGMNRWYNDFKSIYESIINVGNRHQKMDLHFIQQREISALIMKA